jgi:hypothetical protein
MIAVIQCAASKRGDAGFLKTKDGTRVLFVGDPKAAPPSDSILYARPDGISDHGVSWRQELIEYNHSPSANPLRLSRSADLYTNETYRHLVARFGLSKTYILSAGWGLISASFLTQTMT